MRKFNALLTTAIMMLFLYHMIYGGLILSGMVPGGSPIFRVTAYLMLFLIVVHIVIGIKLTIDTLIAEKKSKVSYRKYNRLFWVRRISGFSIMLFMALHVFIFTGTNSEGQYILREFGWLPLLSQLLMVLSLLIHLASNITPLRIALGISDKKNIRTDVLWVISILLILSAIAFIIYFFRWRAV